MQPLKINLTQLQIGANFARVGLPLSKGLITHCDALVVYRDNDRVNATITPTAHWSDGSVKWCMVKISLEHTNLTSAELVVKVADDTPLPAILQIDETDHSISIQSDNFKYVFEKNTDSVFPSVTIDGKDVWNRDNYYPTLTNMFGENCRLQINETRIHEQDNLSCVCIVNGTFSDSTGLHLNTQFKFEVLPGGQLQLLCQLHNPTRASHPGGIWDLGDPGSVKFKDFSIAMENQANCVSKLKLEAESTWVDSTQAMVLFQASSGGQNWDSPVHVNSEGKVCNKFCGYKLTTEHETLQEGTRSNPTLAINTTDNFAFTVQLKDFWQNFPKSIDIEPSSATLRLFPFHHDDGHELQGGERKTHDIFFQFLTDDTIDHVTCTRPIAYIEPGIYKESGVFSYFDHQMSYEPYEKLLHPSMNEERGFNAKREQLDEFGWRNYGEVYADHEAAFHTGDDIFVSHYNNQYDSIWGFAKQFALTGDPRWQQLTIDLAQHVMDIDIYRTDQDRVEYNNGLFWHTDHYAHAQTATHRTFSSLQINDQGHPSSGGGPGPQHCYSSGLVYHYYMTGDTEAKATVLGMGEWIRNYIEGTGSVIEAAKKTLREDSKNFVQTCKGAKIFKYTYPMDRGTGNYLRTLMDCYELTTEKKYLVQIENIISKTAGPSDEIEARGFDNIELTWYYVIFLQEVIRYLDLKRELNQFDHSFYYARATLLHYAKWMVKNEEPYLENAHKLDYPNATWTAQEPRKIHILYAAYKYAVKDRKPFLEKARYFRDYVTNELSTSDTLHYSRIQILLLQNHGPSAFLDMDSLPYPAVMEKPITDQEECFHTPASHLKYIAGVWVSCLSKFKIGNEMRWIKTRTG